MRAFVKLLVLLALAPVVVLVLFALVIAAIAGIPLLWERAVAALTAPPRHDGPPTK